MTLPRANRTNRRVSLDQIVEAAAELIAEEGFDALTMRRLADRCGVGVMTLYGYVRTKEDILGALADRVLGDLELPPGAGGSWQAEVAGVFRSLHQILLEHPAVARIAVTQPIDGLAAYRGAEVVLGALRRAGFSPEASVNAFEVLVSFSAGFTMRQFAFDTPGAVTPDRFRRMADLPAEDFPHMVELAPVFAARQLQRRFDDSLAMVLEGIAASRGGMTP
ncbi:MAG: TetR/AcrR family transcriptional regulator [bacterium]